MKLISCDWGTSRFRIYLMDRENLGVIASLSEDAGIASVNLSWLKQSKMSRIDFFRHHLHHKIQELAHLSREDLAGLPVLISGMASSSIGMLELPYAELPFSIEGKDIIYHKLAANDNNPHDLYLLSGLASTSDVMRGEETQLIGLQNTIRTKKALVILPGTHSKHISIRDGKIVDFSTYMTGEMFATTSQSTILSHSVSQVQIDNTLLFEAFKEGVECADTLGYLSALFKVRTRTLLRQQEDAQNFAFLSGIHLGEELRHLRSLDPDTEIMLCASPNMTQLYKLALRALAIPLKDHALPEELTKLATTFGHMALVDFLNVD